MYHIALLLLIGLLFGTNVAYATDSKEATTKDGEKALLKRVGTQTHPQAVQLVPEGKGITKPQTASAKHKSKINEQSRQDTVDGTAVAGSNTSETPAKPDQQAPAVNYAEELSQFLKMERPAGLARLEKIFSGEPLRQLRAAAQAGNADAQVILAYFYLVPKRRDIPEGIRWLKAAAAQGHEHAKEVLEGTCTYCQNMADADLFKLSESLKHFAMEQKELNMTEDERKKWTVKHGAQIIRYIRGPYYGWRGGHVFCRTRFRVVGDEVWACSPVSALACGKPEASKIFRARLFDGEMLEKTNGPCEGVELSSAWPCYIDSMIDYGHYDRPLTFREPIPMNCEKVERAIRQTPDGDWEWNKIAWSAQEGNAEAQFRLGSMYSDTESSREELVEAVKWLEKAADQGHAGAKAALPKIKARLAEMERK